MKDIAVLCCDDYARRIAKAMCPVSGPVTYFQNCVYRRGVFELG